MNGVGLQGCVKPEFYFGKLAIGLIEINPQYCVPIWNNITREQRQLVRTDTDVVRRTDCEELFLRLNDTGDAPRTTDREEDLLRVHAIRDQQEATGTEMVSYFRITVSLVTPCFFPVQLDLLIFHALKMSGI